MLLYRETNGDLVEAVIEGHGVFRDTIRAKLPHLCRPGCSYSVDSAPSSFVSTDPATDLAELPTEMASQVGKYW